MPRVQKPDLWSEEREKSCRLWVQQLVSLSLLYRKAAGWARVLNFISNLLTGIGLLWPVPTYGCTLLSSGDCLQLTWSGIVVSFVTGITTVLSNIYNVGDRATKYYSSETDLLKLSRKIDLEMKKKSKKRVDPDIFAQQIINEYEAAIEYVRLPWYIKGEEQLANLSLLQSYVEASQCSVREDDDQLQQPIVTTPRSLTLTETDRAMMKRMQYELERLKVGA